MRRASAAHATRHAESLLCRLTGAEAAVVVNNCAAATLLVLAALARGREVLVSRSELVEIGGGFRVPDVMAQSGAQLREVGTTNRTRIGDYALAIGDRTGAILRVHPSNFRIEGFTERATLADLVALARRFYAPAHRGSRQRLRRDRRVATARRRRSEALSREPTVQASIAAGVDVVCFSGDKLLGGPQAGLIVGRAESALARMRRHPLMRALRVDKLTYAALEATLLEYLAGRAPTRCLCSGWRLPGARDWRARRRRGARDFGRRAIPTDVLRRLLNDRRRQRTGQRRCRRVWLRSNHPSLSPDALEDRAPRARSAGHRAH